MSFYRLIILEDDLRLHLDTLKSTSCNLCSNECHSKQHFPNNISILFFQGIF